MNVLRLHVNNIALIFLAVFSAPVVLVMYRTAMEGTVQVCIALYMAS